MEEPGHTPSFAVLGSARSEGHTARALRRLVDGLPCVTLDLLKTPVAPFSYGGAYPPDPFPGALERMASSPVTIFATPVYWFSYSAVMKGFIDRFTDHYPGGGRGPRPAPGSLQGRDFVLMATGTAADLEPALNLAFSQFCDCVGARCIALLYAREGGPFTDEASVALVREKMGAGASDPLRARLPSGVA